MDVDGEFAFVADGKAGLTIIPVSQVKEITDFSVQGADTVSLVVPSPSMSGDYTLRIIDGDASSMLSGALCFVDTSPLEIKNLQDDIVPCESKYWTWTADEIAEFRYAVDQSATWIPEGPFSQLSTSAGITDVKGTWYLHVQARDAYGNVSDVFTVSSVLDSDGDMDNDNLPDDWEKKYFGNLDQTAEADPDGDGFSNIDEYKYGSKPNNGENVPDLCLFSVTPDQGILGQNLKIDLKGSGFTADTRVSIGLDLNNMACIMGSVLPDSPLDFDGDLYDVEIVGDIAYVVGDNRDLWTIDVSDPTNPIAIDYAPALNNGRDIAIAGNFAYVADKDGLQIIDISDPANLSIYSRIGSVEIPGEAYAVLVMGNFAYVADENGLHVIDVSDPTVPVIVGFVETSGVARGIAAGDQVIYVAEGNAFTIIDIKDPTAPSIIHSLGNFWNAQNIVVAEKKAYVVDHNGLYIIDVSDPYAAQSLGSVNTKNWAHDVVVMGQMAYVTCSDSFYSDYGSLQVIDISDPHDPRIVGAVVTPGGAQGLSLLNQTAYVAAGNKGGLQIIDVNTPEKYAYAGSVVDTSGSANNVRVVDQIAYITKLYGDFQIIDLNNLDNNSVIGTVSTDSINNGFALSGTIAYVACSNWGDSSHLMMIDVSDPATPVILHSFETPGQALDVKVIESIAYVADGDEGLQIIDVSDPKSPRILGHIDTQDSAKGIDVVNSKAYVADEDGGLQIIDVNDPVNLRILGGVETKRAVDVKVANQFAYVADSCYGVKIIDVSNSEFPRIVGAVDRLEGCSENITVKNQFAYVSAGDGGVQIIDISDPAVPLLFDTMNMPDHASGVEVVGDKAYVASYAGLVIVPVPHEIMSIDLLASDSMTLTLPNIGISGNYTLQAFNSDDRFALHGAISFSSNTVPTVGDIAPLSRGGWPYHYA